MYCRREKIKLIISQGMLRNLFKQVPKCPRAILSIVPSSCYAIKCDTLGSHRSLWNMPCYGFADKKPPKGFERFDRRKSPRRPIVPRKQAEKEEEEDEQEIKIEQEDEREAKSSKDKKETDKKEKKQKDEKSEEAEKTERNRKEEKEEEEEMEQEEAQNKKKNQKNANFDFSSFLKRNQKGKQTDPKKPFKLTPFQVVAILAGGFLFYSFLAEIEYSYNEISYLDFFKNYLDAGKVTKIDIKRDSKSKNNYVTTAQISTLGDGDKHVIIGDLDAFLEELETHQLKQGRAPGSFIPVSFAYNLDNAKGMERFVGLLYLGLLISLVYFITRDLKSSMNSMKGGSGGGFGGDIFSAGKSQVKIYGLENKIKTKFKDVAGLDEAKVEIMEFVEFLKKPKKFHDLGAKIPRGALLTGPPGTGKTLLAKAAAGEAGVAFLSMSGSDFVEMFVGVGASRVRDLFKKAKEHSPAIIFIDEIDAVGRKRECITTRMGGGDERDNTLNQLLVEMDGFGTESNVIVLAATNRKELLDSALTRPGRFDRSIDITLPDIDGRKDIFLVHLKPLKLDPDRSVDDYARRLATLTPGFSGADIANLCNEAAILAARHNKKFINADDFESATERVLGGLEKKGLVSQEERQIVAIHESGHAVVSWFLEGGSPLLKLTIIPRSKGSLGFAQYLPNENSLETKEELLDRICCILGGRCSEEFFRSKITTGASDDFQKAYGIAEAIVTQFGMSERIGYIGYAEKEYGRAYSDLTASNIDDEIKRIVDECTERCRVVVREHKDEIERLSSALLEKESLDLAAIIKILGPRPFPPKSNFKAYLEQKAEQDQEIEILREKQEAQKKEEEENKNKEDEHETESAEKKEENEDENENKEEDEKEKNKKKKETNANE